MTLQTVYCDCVSIAKSTTPLTVQRGSLYRWKGRTSSSISGKLELKCSPYYGICISDGSKTIPCLVVDPIAAATKLLMLFDKPVIIRDPQFYVEIVATNSNQYDSVHLFLEPDTIKLLDTGPNITALPSEINTTANLDSKNEVYMFAMIPQKISPAILTSKCEVLCLILVTVVYLDENHKKEDVWLVMKNEQVSWKDFILPKMRYIVHLPSRESYDDFKKYKTLHAIADKYFDLPYRQIIHHKDLIKTVAVTTLPENSQIFSNFINSEETPVEDWYSILDERLHRLKFASVYGIIKEINYMDSWNMMNCPWCDPPDSVNRSECDSSIEKSCQNDLNHKWSTLASKSNYEAEDPIELPRFKADPPQSKIIGFGIRGGKINVQISVQEVSSGAMTYVFLKRWKLEQYPAGLAKGVTVCFTDVNVKRSKKSNLYFVNTPLTRILFLNVFSTLKDESITTFGQFGFPRSNCLNEKLWGILDLEMLVKVSIATKCKLCSQIYMQYRCPNVICANSRRDMSEALYEVAATARLFVREERNYESNTLYLKNENVRTYLDLPDQIWRKLCKLSARSELVYSRFFNGISPENTDPLTTFFYLYCKHFRKRYRFHVCCKKFKGDASEERKYFCVEMRKIDSQRVAATRDLPQIEKLSVG